MGPTLYVFVGAGIGGVLRHGVNLAAARIGLAFPVGTLAVNVLGSFLMGIAAGYFLARTGTDQHIRLFVTTGLLGGFTTFSAFSLDAMTLYERSQTGALVAYVAASLLLSVAALAVGLALFRMGFQN